MGLALRDTQTHTYGDYLEWPEDVRYELIDGIAYAMAPAPLRVHQEILLELAAQTRNALEGKSCRPFIAPFDVRLPRGNEADRDIDTVVQPDLVVVCDRAKLDERGCRGAPDWVVEILSPSTAGHDLILKRRLYERVGVREYWLVHPVDRVVTVYRLQHGAFGAPDIYELKDTLAVGILPEIEIDWERALRNIA
ncbi:Uma2 family endonuclease [Thauera sp. 2A1]|uniref:Uma2 family endonuclease n=1 Tax=Thauera sp. 2A1 TaxID=2570191 RepID=UPI001291C3B0|nr:Uma2 family endonuclease [Thauera sp. 2A1]KAI5912714.1 Uma2 family endonuclease [Thauera sp. 2A1]